jgi:hypothetical protein
LSREPNNDPLAFLAFLDRLRYLIVVVAFFVAAILILRTSQGSRIWRQFNLVRDAERIAASGSVTAADVPLLTEASAKAPDRPSLLRALARAAADHDPALARRCYDRITELGAGSPEDLPKRASLLVKFHDADGARALLDQIPANAVSVDSLLANLALHCEVRDFAGAIEVLDTLAARNAAGIRECLGTAEAAVKEEANQDLIAKLEARTVDAFDRTAGAGNIAEVGANAARLAALPLRDSNDRKRALGVLRCLKAAPVEQRLAVTLLTLDTVGASEEEIRRACLAEIHRGAGLTVPEERRVASLLQQRHQHALVVKLITLPESMTDPALFRQRLDSLLQLGQWREASMMAAAPPEWTVGSQQLLRCLAKANRSGFDGVDFSVTIPEALKEAAETGSAPACYAIGCAALELRQDRLATEAFSAALSQPSIDTFMMGTILGSARAAKLDASSTLRILTGSGLPARVNRAVKTRVCYLRLLAGKDVPAVQGDLDSLARDGDNDAYVSFLNALSLHRRGDLVEAKRRIAPLRPQRWNEGEAAVIAGMMAAAGEYQDGASLMQNIDLNRLFPEERAMVAPWLSHLSSAKQAVGISTVGMTESQ